MGLGCRAAEKPVCSRSTLSSWAGSRGSDTSTAMFTEQAAQRAPTLLSPPSATNATFARVPVSTYTNASQPFRLGERSFSRQYAHIYATRLIQMRPFLESRAQQHWGKLVGLGAESTFGVVYEGVVHLMGVVCGRWPCQQWAWSVGVWPTGMIGLWAWLTCRECSSLRRAWFG